MKHALIALTAVTGMGFSLAADSMTEIINKAKLEGKIVSYGSPDDWAGYGEIWKLMTSKYGLEHHDTDMSSAEEIAKWVAEKNAPVSDAGDVGLQFVQSGIEQDAFLPYKHSRWNDVPAWGKDSEGKYSAAYYGVISFTVNKNVVKNVPRSWKDLLKPEYKNMIGLDDPRKAAVASYAVIAAAFANGGSEKNIQPGIDYFAKLQKSGKLTPAAPSVANIQKGEVGIAIIWDFSGLAYKKEIGKDTPLEVLIPSDGTTLGAYATVINKYTLHPNAARLFIETVHSNEGQIAMARAGARPIHKVTLPADVKATLIPETQYKSLKPITDWKGMPEVAKRIGEKWATEVLEK
jgi:putative spermidine/putrescine transport system substrate-binding protein